MRSILIALFCLVASGIDASAQGTIAPQVGGAGGGAFVDNCKPGDVLIGYNITSGKALNEFAAVCQAQTNGVLVGKNYGLRTWGHADYNGGPFFGTDTPRCPSGSAMSELNVWVNTFNEVDSVSATCTALLPNTVKAANLDRSSTNGGQAVRNGASGCRAGQIAVGITGRSGALVDALGLQCASFPWSQVVTRPTPPVVPPAQKFVSVVRDVDVYGRPAPPASERPEGTLRKGTPDVTLVQRGPAGWYRLSWPGKPAGVDWVYSAADFTSLDPATLGP